MKTTTHLALRNSRFALVFALLSTISPHLSSLYAQATAFTYQGRLNERGAAVNGTYDFRFTIYNRDTGGTSPLEPVAVSRVAVSNGLFTVELDFGSLGSTQRWLEIEVRSRDGGGDYAVLSPRQLLTATPRAHYALQAGDVLNPVPDALIPSTVARLGGNNVFTGMVSFVVPPRFEGPPFTVNTSAQVPNLNADYLDGFDSSAFWKVIGNAGTSPDFHFLGTTDNQPLELRVNNERVLRLAYATSQFFTSPNIVGGFSENAVSPGFVGGFIAAGGLPSDGGFPSTPNVVNNHFGSIGGGFGNRAGGFASIVDGGRFNLCGGSDSVVGGGYANTNPIAGFATIGGGQYNNVNGSWGMVPGGRDNTANGQYSFAAGRRAKALHDGAFVWGDSQDVNFASTANNQFCIRAAGGVGIGTTAPNSTLHVQGSGNRAAISAYSPTINSAVYGENTSSGFGVSGRTTGSGYAVYGDNTNAAGYAGFFNGNVHVTGTISPPSDRHVKRDFETVNAREVLEKVAALSIQTWAYTNDTAAARHLGPVAQDFKAAFGLGADDTSIATVDADGVALAAIQGLHQKLEEELRVRRAEIDSLKTQNRSLEERLIALEKAMSRDR